MHHGISAEAGGNIIGRIQERDGFVVIDSRDCDARRLFYGYQTFGLLCAYGKVSAAMVRTGNEDAEGHYALRDILVTLARIAGIALRFRLAFVARSDELAGVCRTMQKDLTPLGCELEVFQAERQAHEWVRGGERHELQPAPRSPKRWAQGGPSFSNSGG